MDYISKPTKIDTMIELTIHEEQPRLRGVEAYVRKYCAPLVSDFRNTWTELNGLLSRFADNPVYITANADGQRTWVDVYINPNNKKRLAGAVVYEVRHYLGNTENSPQNAKDAAIIEEMADAWLQTIPDTYITKPDLYPGRVFDRSMLELQAVKYFDLSGKMTPPRYEFPPEGITLDGCKISDSDLAAIVEAFGRWVKSKDQQHAPTVQRLPDELKTETAQAYFAKAVELGLMTEGYKWLSGLQVLACFAREMSINLNLGKGGRISWKPFETLFDIDPGKLRLNYNDIQKTGQDPRDAHLVDEVFK